MRIDELATVDFSQNWLACSRYGELYLAGKHHKALRWIYTLLTVITLGCIDFYAHIRINRVANALFDGFKKDYINRPDARRYYLKVMDNLLLENMTPIATYRTALQNLRAKVGTYSQEA